jgi:hypothetical protein
MLSFCEKYDALVRKDPAYEGIFLCGENHHDLLSHDKHREEAKS